jgi:hypothetical protein
MQRVVPLALAGWCVVMLGLQAPARAAEFNMKVTTDDISLGKHIYGPDLTRDDLKHRVVLVEFWGIH